jgi:hypothetical protein
MYIASLFVIDSVIQGVTLFEDIRKYLCGFYGFLRIIYLLMCMLMQVAIIRIIHALLLIYVFRYFIFSLYKNG